MTEFNGENKVEGVFGGVNFDNKENASNVQGNGNNSINGGNIGNNTDNNDTIFTKVESKNLPIKPSIWTKIKTFLFQEIDLTVPIKVELTPYQQKVEDEINEFLHQEISFKGFFNLFKSEK